MQRKAIGWLVVLVISLIFIACQPFHLSRKPPPVRIPSEDLQADLVYLFQTMERVHPNLYAYTPRSVIDSLRKEVIQQLTKPMTAMEFYMLVAPIVTSLNDGHTELDFPFVQWGQYLSQGGKQVPLGVFIRADSLYVKHNYIGDTTLAINSTLLSINGIPAKTILQRIMRYQSGERLTYRYHKAGRLFPPFLWGIFNFTDQFTLEYISALNSHRYTRTFPGISAKTLDSLKTKTRTKGTSVPYTFTILPQTHIGLITWRRFRDLSRFESFLDTTFSRIRQDSIQDLIIDIRNNGGGSSTLGDALFNYITDQPYTQVAQIQVKASRMARRQFRQRVFQWYMYPLYPLVYFHPATRGIFGYPPGTISTHIREPGKPSKKPGRFTGQVYLLIGPRTFSSASMFAATFQCYDMGVTIGDETGGVTVSYGDNVYYTLPHTQLKGTVSYKRFVLPCGKEDGHGVIPDYQVRTTPEDLRNGRDTVLEFTKKFIQSHHQQ